MFITKTKSGIYYLYYNDENYRRQKVSTRARRKSDAYKFLQTFKVENAKKKAPMLFSTFMIQFFEYSRNNLMSSTLEIYQRTREIFLETIGDMLMERLTPYHWDKYVSLRLQKVSPVTVNIELRALRSIANKAYRWRIIKENPFALLPGCRVPEKFPEYFTKEEFAAFQCSVEDEWFKDLTLFALLTGMRRSEITNLLWNKIDFEKKMIQVVSNPTFKVKAGKKESSLFTKTFLPMLKRRFQKHPEGLVFTFEGQKIREDFVTHKFRKVLKASGITKTGLRFHSFRHTFASWLVQDGVPLYEVQRLLGHSTIAVTEMYSHLQPCQLHSAVNKLRIAPNESSSEAMLKEFQQPPPTPR